MRPVLEYAAVLALAALGACAANAPASLPSAGAESATSPYSIVVENPRSQPVELYYHSFPTWPRRPLGSVAAHETAEIAIPESRSRTILLVAEVGEEVENIDVRLSEEKPVRVRLGTGKQFWP